MNFCSVFDKISTEIFPSRAFKDCPSENCAGPGPAAEMRNTPEDQTSHRTLDPYHLQQNPAGCQGLGMKVWRGGDVKGSEVTSIIISINQHLTELLACRHFSITHYLALLVRQEQGWI